VSGGRQRPPFNRQTLGFLDYSFSSVKLTALTTQVAINFNLYQLCGINHWVAGRSENIAGLDCGGQLIPDLDSPVYDRILESKDAIQLGRASDELNGSSAALRTPALDDVIYRAK
jgi:hypothetical protein